MNEIFLGIIIVIAYVLAFLASVEYLISKRRKRELEEERKFKLIDYMVIDNTKELEDMLMKSLTNEEYIGYIKGRGIERWYEQYKLIHHKNEERAKRCILKLSALDLKDSE